MHAPAAAPPPFVHPHLPHKYPPCASPPLPAASLPLLRDVRFPLWASSSAATSHRSLPAGAQMLMAPVAAPPPAYTHQTHGHFPSSLQPSYHLPSCHFCWAFLLSPYLLLCCAARSAPDPLAAVLATVPCMLSLRCPSFCCCSSCCALWALNPCCCCCCCDCCALRAMSIDPLSDPAQEPTATAPAAVPCALLLGNPYCCCCCCSSNCCALRATNIDPLSPLLMRRSSSRYSVSM